MGKIKRKLALILSLCLILSIGFAGCGKADTSAPAASTAASATPAEAAKAATTAAASSAAPAAGSDGTGGITLPVSKDLVEYTFMLSEEAKVPVIDSFVVLPELEKRTNVRFKLIKVPTANYADKLSVTLASGDIPDYISGVNVSIANQYGPKGMFLNIWKYIDQMPNMKRVFDTIPGTGAYKYSDNELYQLLVQMSPDSDPQGFGYYREIPMIRMDVLDKLKLKVPTTFDELYTTLQAIKTAYPESYPWVSPGGDNTSGLEPLITHMLLAWSGDLFSWSNNYTVYDEKTKKWSFALERPGFKELIEYIAKAYKDKLLDPEFIVANGPQWEERMLNDKGFFSYSYWNNSDNINIKAKAAGKQNFKVAGFLPPVKNGKAGVVVRQICNNTNAVSAKVKNPEILLKALDYWLYSKDGTMLANAGIEGVNFKWDSTGKIYTLIDPDRPNPTNETHKAKYGVRYGFMTGLRPDHFDLHGAVPDPDNNLYYQQQLIYKGKGVNPAPVKIYKNPDDMSTMKQIGVPIRDYIEQELSKMIMGTGDIGKWDQLVKTCKDMGSDKMLEVLNK